MTEMNWSMMPQGMPANSCSAFWQSSAFSTGSSFLPVTASSSGGGGDFQRGAAGKAAAQRHGGMQQHVETAGVEAAREEAGDDAARIIRPVAPANRA